MKCVVIFVLIELSVTEIMIRGTVPIVVVHKLLVSDWKDFLGDEFIIVHSLYLFSRSFVRYIFYVVTDEAKVDVLESIL